MTQKIKSSICKDVAVNISEYIKHELSDSVIERFSAHINKCPNCKVLLQKEIIFEKELLHAAKQELSFCGADKSNMEKLNHSIMEKIKITPQEKKKLMIEPSMAKQPVKSDVTLSGLIVDLFLSLLTPKAIIAAAPIIIVIVMVIAITKMSNFKSTDKILSKDTTRQTIKNIQVYNEKRDVSSLYGYNNSNSLNGYISGFASNISKFNPELQRTIINKLEKMEFTKNSTRKNKLSKLSNLSK